MLMVKYNRILLKLSGESLSGESGHGINPEMLSEYIAQLASMRPATVLDINNSVPADVVSKGADLKGAEVEDLFMGFHCGNTSSTCMKDCCMKYQFIMNRLMEDGKKPDITRGTLEGQLRPGENPFELLG